MFGPLWKVKWSCIYARNVKYIEAQYNIIKRCEVLPNIIQT